MIQPVASFLYPGGCASKNALASLFSARTFAVARSNMSRFGVVVSYAARSARREADRPPLGVEIAPHAVDPAKRQRRVERLVIGNPVLVGALLVKPDDQFCLAIMMLRK